METQDALAALSALAQESRLGIFRLLVEAGPEGIAAGELAQRLGISPPTMSFHLRLLSHAHLVRARRRGRSVHYSASFDVMNQLIGYLTENCCGGDPSACMPGRSRRPPAAASTGRKARAARPRARN